MSRFNRWQIRSTRPGSLCPGSQEGCQRGHEERLGNGDQMGNRLGELNPVYKVFLMVISSLCFRRMVLLCNFLAF